MGKYEIQSHLQMGVQHLSSDMNQMYSCRQVAGSLTQGVCVCVQGGGGVCVHVGEVYLKPTDTTGSALKTHSTR